jgi:hypothetical protein
MAEFEHPHVIHVAPVAMLDRSIVQRDLYILVALFLADEKITALENAVTDSAEAYLEDEIEARLLSTAALLRAWDDQLAQAQNPSEAVRKLRAQTCGSLEEKIGRQAVGLTLREACDRIIHAERITFDIDQHPVAHRPYANPKIYLYGSHGRQQWRATVNIIEYAAIGTAYANG